MGGWEGKKKKGKERPQGEVSQDVRGQLPLDRWRGGRGLQRDQSNRGRNVISVKMGKIVL